MDFTIVNYYGKQTSKCGYCKGKECSIAHGMHAYHMSPLDYQDLIDRGWRRSGHYCYKPHNATTCCPCYTIKCDSLEFKLSKSHKKILKRMNRFLRDGKKDKNEETVGNTNATTANTIESGDCDGAAGGSRGGGLRDEPQAPNVAIREVDLAAVAAANHTEMDKHPRTNSSVEIEEEATDVTDGAANSSGSQSGSKKSFDGQNPPCKKAKQMRLERRQAKLAAKGIIETATAVASTPSSSATLSTAPAKNNVNQEKSLTQFVVEAGPNDKHKLKIILVPSSKSVTNEAFLLYRKYQLTIHNDNPQRLTTTSLQRFCYKSPIKLDLVHVRGKQFATTLASTYTLYQKYQSRIHNDPPADCEEYLEFLQRSPLKNTKTPDGPPQGYGSFHQQYWLDDKLIAVGVIDILPYCVSSVYFFYDPDYSFLSLGTYGSLREIEFVQQLAAKVPALKYYYMGFYIHSCPKMRYKGKLLPSYLLCPETYFWNLLTDEMRAQLDANKYQRLNANSTAKDANEFMENHLDMVRLLLENNTSVTYRQYIQSFNIQTLDNMLDIIRSRIYKEITGEEDDRESVLEYGKLVGKTCAHRMLYLKM